MNKKISTSYSSFSTSPLFVHICTQLQLSLSKALLRKCTSLNHFVYFISKAMTIVKFLIMDHSNNMQQNQVCYNYMYLYY